MTRETFAVCVAVLFWTSVLGMGLMLARFAAPLGHPLHVVAKAWLVCQHVLLWATLALWAVTQ